MRADNLYFLLITILLLPSLVFGEVHERKSIITCWKNGENVIELTLFEESKKGFEKRGIVRKNIDDAPIKIEFSKIVNKDETSEGRPLEVVSLWNEYDQNHRKTGKYLLTVQGVINSLEYHRNQKIIEYEKNTPLHNKGCFD
jgi:hypothetical protein